MLNNTREVGENEMAPMTVLELEVNNHPGVMSHICGLFSRRAYNLEGIVCITIGSGLTSRMLLQVNEQSKLEQIIKQVKKLPDVFKLTRHDQGHLIFDEIETKLRSS